MRVSFRVKVFLAFSLAVAPLLIGALLIVDWQFGRFYDDRVAISFEEIGESIKLLQAQQVAALKPFADTLNIRKVWTAIEENDPKLLQEVEVQVRFMKPPCKRFAIANREGRILLRGRPVDDPDVPWEIKPVKENDPSPERALIGRVEQGSGYFVAEGSLYYGTCVRLRHSDADERTDYGYVILWNPIRDELEAVRKIYLHVPVFYLVNGTTQDPAFSGLPVLPDRVVTSITWQGKPYSAIRTAVQASVDRVLMFSEDARQQFHEQIFRVVLAVLIGALMLALLATFAIARGISKPVLRLVDAAHEIERGNYQVRVDIRSRDELGRLGAAFNEMAKGLEEREKRKAIMQKTLSVDIESEFMSADRVALGGELAEATIMFVDIRGFTTMTEGMPPDRVVEMLNEYMTMAERVIRHNRGNVNKFIGDGILALFGVPQKRGDPPLDAVRAGRELLSELAALNQTRQRRGEKEIRIGIGINTGQVLKGNVGSDQRLEFTVIGEEVNLASRLCSNAKPLQVLISETTYRKVSERIQTNALAPIAVKGFSKPVPVYEVISVS